MEVFINVMLWLPGIAAITMGVLDLREEKQFIENAKETKGTIVGTVGAKYKIRNQYGVDLAGTASAGAATQYVKGDQLGGAFLIVEYETKNGDVYQVRSRQPFNTLPDEEVTVHYNREKPGEAIVERFYNSNAKYYQIAGGIVFMLLPFLIHFLN